LHRDGGQHVDRERRALGAITDRLREIALEPAHRLFHLVRHCETSLMRDWPVVADASAKRLLSPAARPVIGAQL